MAQFGQYSYSWIDDNQLKNLLGNARPKTLQDIQNDGYWDAIFSEWIAWADYNGYGGVKAVYDQWKADPNGPSRDQLKSFGPNGDLRNDFYNAVGEVKAAYRDWETTSGAAADRLEDSLKDLGLSS